jgi:DNA polymerase III alpha subunit (gram-positive type)
MKYVSIDIETTGLDPARHQVLTIGAVVEDTKKVMPLDRLPSFHAMIIRSEVTGQITALNMNKDIIQLQQNYMNCANDMEKYELSVSRDTIFCSEDEVIIEFYKFLRTHLVPDAPAEAFFLNGKPSSNVPKIKFNAAGKNLVSFDLKFLEQLPRWKQLLQVKQRIIDPAILFTEWYSDDGLPNLSTCKVRAGLDPNVSHDALGDAMDVVQLIRNYITNTYNVVWGAQ